MRKVLARYNAGRWVVDCPIHGVDGAVLAVPSDDPSQSRFLTVNNEYICPACYPGITAEFHTLRNGRLEKLPDRSARATAYRLAMANDEIYQVIFPKEREQIEKVLAERPRLMQNWDGPHETLKFLKAENKIVKAIVKEKERHAL